MDIAKSDSAFQEKYQSLEFVLEGYTGKRKYKYLKPHQKNAVDEILRELENDKNIQYLYGQWQQIQLAILGIYSKKHELICENISEGKTFIGPKN